VFEQVVLKIRLLTLCHIQIFFHSIKWHSMKKITQCQSKLLSTIRHVLYVQWKSIKNPDARIADLFLCTVLSYWEADASELYLVPMRFDDKFVERIGELYLDMCGILFSCECSTTLHYQCLFSLCVCRSGIYFMTLFSLIVYEHVMDDVLCIYVYDSSI
jgi:hypothetical protein